MRQFFVQRLLLLVPTLLCVITLVFFMIVAAPGDPARIMLGEHANAEQLEQLRKDMGLNDPLHIRYWKYISRIAVLDFGRSVVSNRPVLEDIASFFPATIELTFFAMFIAVCLGIPLGILAATRKNSFLDYSSMTGALVGVSMPVFWLGLVLIMVFSVQLNLFPTGGRINARLFFVPHTNFYLIDGLLFFFRSGDIRALLSMLRHIVLPAIALATIPLAIIARVTRSSMLEVLKQDYIKTAQAAGIKWRWILYRYALRNALLPVITVIGLQFGLLLSGAILTETVFAWPGLGRWVYGAISARDYPAIQGGIIIIATTFIIINIAVDFLYTLVNPKIRVHK